jgi:hypothetical protein
LRFSEKRRKTAAFQDAGARYFVPRGINASRWYFTQNRQKCLCKGLIFSGLRRKTAFFDPFIALKGVDLPSLTKKVPDFFAGGACTQFLFRADAGREYRLSAESRHG